MAYFQTDSLWINDLGNGAAAIVLDVVDRSVNVIGPRFLDDFADALERVQANESFRLLFIRSGKPGNFCAGADVQQFGADVTSTDASRLSAQGQQVFGKLAELRLPSVAVIAGSCLGGGLELALACDYRLAVVRPETRLGLPEIELGLIPGWGGTQRLPRIVGLERALQIMLGGRRLHAGLAWQWGLVDRTLQNEDEAYTAIGAAEKRNCQRLPLRSWRERLFESTGFGRSLIFRGANAVLRRRLPDDMPAPFELVQAVRTGLRQGFTAGLEYEQEAIGRLVQTSACRNLLRVFHLREEARKRSGSEPPRKIGIIGGTSTAMDLVQLAVLRGSNVVVREANEAALGFAMLHIMALLQQAVERGQIAPSELQAKLAAVQGTTAWKNFDEVGLVVDASSGDISKRRNLLGEAEANTQSGTHFAVNTSTVSIAELQQAAQRPEYVGGLHFLEPVQKMPLVEVVAGPQTSAAATALLADVARSLGKTPIVVRDSPGLLVDRIMLPYLNEAVQIVSEGVRIAVVDEAMRLFGMALGPLELLDEMGIDRALDIGARILPALAGEQRMHPAFADIVQRGWLGRKTHKGFYRYQKSKKRVNLLAESLLHQHESATSQRTALSKADQIAKIRERLVSLMIDEAKRCLDEKVADNADAIDLALILGSGWAPHRGGPLHYAQATQPHPA